MRVISTHVVELYWFRRSSCLRVDSQLNAHFLVHVSHCLDSAVGMSKVVRSRALNSTYVTCNDVIPEYSVPIKEARYVTLKRANRVSTEQGSIRNASPSSQLQIRRTSMYTHIITKHLNMILHHLISFHHLCPNPPQLDAQTPNQPA